MSLKVTTSIVVELEDSTVKHVAMTFLSRLTRDQWVEERNGKLVLREEHATSHRYDADVSYQDPVRIAIVKAVQDFRAALKAYEEAFAKDGRK